MTATPEPITAEELQRRLRAREPGALLVPPRILRRVIKRDRGLGGIGLQVPHRDSYVIDRDRALGIADRDELGCPTDLALPDTLVLLARPEPATLARRPGGVLRAAWRELFHARLHAALARRKRAGKLPPDVVREQIRAIGKLEFEEARAVLTQENVLLPPHPGESEGTPAERADREAYVELACTFHEQRAFDPERLSHWFPSADLDRLARAFAADDVPALLGDSRPEGAPEPELAMQETASADTEALSVAPPEPDAAERAAGAATRGNQVRAALLLQRAGKTDEARAQLDGLMTRLEKALGLSEGQVAAWRAGLEGLLPRAAGGVWNVEGRLLYDVQMVCVDNERDVFAVDLIEWFVSWFRRPIKRPLPDQPAVLTVKHLRNAAERLPGAHLPADARRQLTEALHRALEDAEVRLRDRLRPKLHGALDAVSLAPGNLAERLSRDKLVEELLDLVVARGYLTLGDLRDALARNRVKLPDLVNPVEFLTGDPLLRANRQLARDLDGVYRRGEIYLRWLQRLSSLFFGNPVGRFLTLYLILPVLGAFFLLKGLEEIAELLHKFAGLPKPPHVPDVAYGGLALFLLPLLHWPAFRRAVWRGVVLLWHLGRAVFWDLPASVLRLPLIRRILQSKTYLIFYEYAGKPLALTVPLALLLWALGVELATAALCWAGAALLASALLNSRLGLVVEEAAADRMVRVWQMIRDDLLPGLFRWVMYVFRQLVERVERVLYAVDEWQRFRSGQGRLAFAGKLVFGLFWFWVVYVVRFVVNLLVEPQINPIKHFPVVTVSHKLILPLAIPPGHGQLSPLGALLQAVLPLTVDRANWVAGTVVWGIPGIFGFLAWELKENWRLYKSNMSPTLDPEVVGSHGERVINLLRPGFHSGTLPKLFAKLRRLHGKAERRAEEGLHHVEQEVRRFAERDLIAYLAASNRWGLSASVYLGHVRLGVSRIRLEVCCPGLAGESLLLDLEHHGGRLLAGLARIGWAAGLTPARRRTLTAVLAGFYHLAGVDLVREQLTAALPAGAEYDVTAEGLVVRPPGAEYDLADPAAPPQPPAPGLPPRSAELLFRVPRIRWADWVATWEHDRGSNVDPGPLTRAPLLGPAA
jgi:hypothetical protein